MKKLLLILLLFFPVHGAWAKTLYLKCTDKNGKTRDFKFDTIKKTMVNEYGNSHDIEITDNVFKWITSEFLPENIAAPFRKNPGLESGKLVGLVENSLNRYNGSKFTKNYATTEENFKKLYHAYGEKDILNHLNLLFVSESQCEKTSTKKKF